MASPKPPSDERPMTDDRVPNWHLPCPYCDHVAKGFHDCRTKDDNAHWKLVEHVNAAHPDQAVPAPASVAA